MNQFNIHVMVKDSIVYFNMGKAGAAVEAHAEEAPQGLFDPYGSFPLSDL